MLNKPVKSFLWSAALSIKMSVLLYLPGLLVVFFKRRGLVTSLRHLTTIMLSQILLATPFLAENWHSYLNRAFDLSRAFLYQWTVNWRFVDEGTFSSPRWAKSLLVSHVSTLLAFGLFRWCKNDGGVWRVLERGVRWPTLPAGRVSITADRESLPRWFCCDWMNCGVQKLQLWCLRLIWLE